MFGLRTRNLKTKTVLKARFFSMRLYFVSCLSDVFLVEFHRNLAFVRDKSIRLSSKLDHFSTELS